MFFFFNLLRWPGTQAQCQIELVLDGKLNLYLILNVKLSTFHNLVIWFLAILFCMEFLSPP